MPPEDYPATTTATEGDPDKPLLELATERFKQSHEAHTDDFEACEDAQEFIAGDQWPEGIKKDRENQDRPCLTLDHLNQYVRHVVNSGLKQSRDVRVLATSGEADEKVADILAGMIRQITQTSTSKVAYETGLRHSCQVGFGYWRCKVQEIKGTKDETGAALLEITIRKIKDPRMVLFDPFCEYPDGRDAQYCFVLSKLTNRDFKSQYGETEAKSWHTLDTSSTLPWIADDAIVVAEYYYIEPDGTMKWCVLCPDKVLARGIHHGNVMPIIRVVGEEYEVDGKERRRGMINGSSMDAQRAYNYSSSAFIEAVALAPLAPFIAAAGQIEQYVGEWKDAHRVPRAVLRYDPVSVGGQPVPAPQRAEPAGIPQGWQGMMQNLISDTQMIMGLAQPSVLGTGGTPVQSGAGIEAQQAPGEINTFHFYEHWHMAIEQTGRVLLAMIPHVYTKPQAVKIVGDDGVMRTALINPSQDQTVMDTNIGYEKVLSKSYNPNIGRYDVAISTGPSSASKKSETNKMMMTMVNADPSLMKIAGDLIVGSMDMAGADVLAKRLAALLPPGIGEDDKVKVAMLQQALQENGDLKQQLSDMEKIIVGEREKAQADILKQQMENKVRIQELIADNRSELLKQQLDDQAALSIASLKAKVDLETNTQNAVVKIIVERLRSKTAVDIAAVKVFAESLQLPTHEDRMEGYVGSLDALLQGIEPEAPPPPPPQPTSSRKGWRIVRDEDGNMAQILATEPTAQDGWQVVRDEKGDMAQIMPIGH